MSDTKAVVTGSGFPTIPILTILFVLLKVTGYIHWSWLWVFAPFWIPLGVVVGLAGLFLGGVVVVALVLAIMEK